MRLSAVKKSKIMLGVYFFPKIQKKWRIPLLLFLTVVAFLISTLILSPHRQKTSVIVNNKGLCASNARKYNERSVVIVVLSDRKNFLNRNLIRGTYGSVRKSNGIRILGIVFMLGNLDPPGAEKADLDRLEDEMNQFGDLVIGDFVDSNANLTRKTIMAFEWVTSYCQDAHIVVKTNDNVMVNIFKLTETLDTWSRCQIRSLTIFCGVNTDEHVIANMGGGFDVTPDELPKHCIGIGYVTPIGVIRRIVDEISRSFLEPVYIPEDVFITGIVPQKINSEISFNWNSDCDQNKPIEIVDKFRDWITYALDGERSADAQFISMLFRERANETTNFKEYRKRFGRKIFYRLNQNDEFEETYRRLWHVIDKNYGFGQY